MILTELLAHKLKLMQIFYRLPKLTSEYDNNKNNYFKFYMSNLVKRFQVVHYLIKSYKYVELLRRVLTLLIGSIIVAKY